MLLSLLFWFCPLTNFIFQSAFSERFSSFGCNVYDLFVPNLMHKFELGAWKGMFTHLIRVLIAVGQDGCQRLDER